MPLPFEDSRRLTGANLYFPVPGAVLDTTPGTIVDKAAAAHWRANVERLSRELGWPSAPVVARLHDGRGSLAIAAPVDQLFTATEVNELALYLAMPSLPFSSGDHFHAPAYPAIWDEELALQTLRLAATAERRPDLTALLDEAHRRDLAVLLDDTELTLGEGNGARTWPLDALPPPDTVDWPALHGIPVALVTGSNGKTTTTRLVAAMCAENDWRTALSSTDGVSLDGVVLAEGDYSGPAGARLALRNPHTQAAVLETARGGILRRGLAVERARTSIVTNISADHFGEYGVCSLDDLADAKLVVARVLGADGTLVLNADDATLMHHARTLRCRQAWFALDHDAEPLRAHRAAGNATCGVRGGHLILFAHDREHDLGAVTEMPLSFGGAARYNIANLAGAALLGNAMGIPANLIAAVLGRFGARNEDNPGRLMRWRFGATQVLLDYAHNPDGLGHLLELARGLHPQGRLAVALGQAGNREDGDIRELAAITARHHPDFVLVKQLDAFLRGRMPGEVAALLREALIAHRVEAARIAECAEEIDAARAALEWARDGDLLVLPIHTKIGRIAVIALLDRLAQLDWQPQRPLPSA